MNLVLGNLGLNVKTNRCMVYWTVMGNRMFYPLLDLSIKPNFK